jgi:uncharacterized protein
MAASGDSLAGPGCFGPISLLVIQPTPFCNLDCDYCYLPDRGNRNRITLDLVDLALRRVLESPFLAGDFTLLWHAGEPLTMPMAFYDDATACLRRAEQRSTHQPLQIFQHIQTNAILIDQRWCECFLRNRIAVGVSLDGPAFLHDAHRRTRAGLGSHAATMRGIGHLQRHGIPFSVIAVLTEESLAHPEAIFEFFVEHDITDVGFNMEETEGANSNSSLDGAATEERYRSFLQRFWELTVQSQGRFRLREFEATSSLAYADARLAQTDMNNPFVIVNVDHLGNFCTFDPELLSVRTPEYGEFILGNVRTDSLASVCETDRFRQMHRDMAAGVSLCRQTCEYFGLCGGGAGSNKYWENGSLASAETQACRYRIKMVADVVLAGLENSLGLNEVVNEAVPTELG